MSNNLEKIKVVYTDIEDLNGITAFKYYPCKLKETLWGLNELYNILDDIKFKLVIVLDTPCAHLNMHKWITKEVTKEEFKANQDSFIKDYNDSNT